MTSSDEQINLTHTKKLGNSQFDVFCKSTPQLSHWIFSIQKYLRKYHHFYYNSLLTINKGRSIQTIEKRLKQQFDKLTQQKSLYQIIQKALISREKCIEKIKRQLNKAQRVLTMFKKQYFKQGNVNHSIYRQYVELEGYSNVQIQQTIQNSIQIISGIFIDMSRLRDMTVYVVQTIHKWKIQTQEWSDKCNQYSPVFWIHNNQNVYDIILEDTKFIWESALSQYIYFDTTNDPFMVRNVLQVQERQSKTILQKYFIQLLYPKKQQIVSKSVKCYQMLTFKYQPQVNNLYREQQLLIQNYLSLRKKQQQEEGIQNIQQKQFQWQDKIKQENRNKLNSKGWIFGKILKKPQNQKINDMIERHQQKISFIKPFNIANYSQKNSIALAYISQAKQVQPPGVLSLKQLQSRNQSNIFSNKKQKDISKIYRTRSTQQIKRSQSQKKVSYESEKGYKSQNQAASNKLSRMYQSLSKINPIILQDPQQYNQQTPKHKPKDIKNFKKNILTESQSDTKQFMSLQLGNKLKTKQDPSQSDNKNSPNNPTPILLKKKPTLKFNTFNTTAQKTNQQPEKQNGQKEQNLNRIPQENKNKKQQSPINKQQDPVNKILTTAGIQVQQGEKQLNFGQFLQNFRANTNQKVKSLQKEKKKNEQRKKKIQSNQNKLLTIRQLIQTNKIKNRIALNSRTSPILSLKNKSPYSSKLGKIPNKGNSKNKDQNSNNSRLNKSHENQQNSFSQYKQITSQEKRSQNLKQPFKFSQDFIILTSKSIPIDIVPTYLRHLFNQIHSTSKKFTLYSYDQLLKKLQDPYTQCIVFEVSTQKKGHIGQVILSQSLGVNNQKLRYTIQFMNIHMFQMVVASILRIAQQLLYATPCQQVICPLIEDKLDPVSVHFIDLIQNAFKNKVQIFGELTILQRKRLYYKDSDLHQRLYIFTSKNKRLQELKISKAMMGNYRSIKLECKCLMLSANFRMRSKTIAKNVISNYQSVSLGYLYRKVLQKIITKYHLRQMKISSVNANESDQTSIMIKQNSFLRTSMSALAQYLKQQINNQQDYIYMTRFTNMSQVLTYLDYKQYSQYFHFSFLQQSRFILNHELFLTQIQMDVSLQFMVRSSIQFLILYNHHNLPIKLIQPNKVSKAKGVILPTTNQQIQLILIDGREYQLQTTDKLDLFSYLYIYQHQNIPTYQQTTNIKQIVIPMIHKNNKNVTNIRMFDGLFRLFPERQFYSGTYFKCTNLWETYFPSAVVYKPEKESIVFEYPLIVGFFHKTRKQILTAFLLKNTNFQ